MSMVALNVEFAMLSEAPLAISAGIAACAAAAAAEELYPRSTTAPTVYVSNAPAVALDASCWISDMYCGKE